MNILKYIDICFSGIRISLSLINAVLQNYPNKNVNYKQDKTADPSRGIMSNRSANNQAYKKDT